jgi:hypothetical protein
MLISKKLRTASVVFTCAPFSAKNLTTGSNLLNTAMYNAVKPAYNVKNYSVQHTLLLISNGVPLASKSFTVSK